MHDYKEQIENGTLSENEVPKMIKDVFGYYDPYFNIDNKNNRSDVNLNRDELLETIRTSPFVKKTIANYYGCPEEDAIGILEEAKNFDPKSADMILVKGDVTVTTEAARVFAEAGIKLYGNESQTVGPLDAPMEVHHIMLGAKIVLLEGIRLSEIPAGSFLLNAAPINLGGTDGAPCRAVLIEN